MPILQPETTLNIIGAQTLQQVTAQRALLIGQKTSDGSATAGALSQDVPDSDSAIEAKYGVKSHLTRMIKDFKAINKVTALDVIPLDDDGAAVDATATITVAAGTATADATINVYVFDKTKFNADVAITSGDDQDAIAGKIDAAMSAIEAKFPFVTTSALNVVTFTPSNGGPIYNGAPIGISGSIPGISSLTIAAFASGATNPTLTSIFDVIGNIRYQTIGWPAAYATTELQTLLDARFNASYRVLDGVGVTGIVDTYANLLGGPSENSASILYVADKLIDGTDHKGAAIPNLTDQKIAAFCATRALRLSEDASLTQILTTVSPADQFGGSAISTLPYHNTKILGLTVPLPQDEFSLSEIKQLASDGYTIMGANVAFNAVILNSAVTTYQTNAAGDPDTSFFQLNRVDTSSAIREFYAINLKARYAQSRLTGGDLVARRDIANEESIRSFCKRLYQELADLAITEKGADALSDYETTLSVIVDVGAGSITVDQAPLQVGQVRLIIGTVAVNYSGLT